MRLLRNSLTASLVLILLGCATTRLYDGPPKPANEVVEITGMSGLDPLGQFTSALVCAIDDKKIEGCAAHVEILPGFHKLKTVTKSYGITEREVTIDGDFKAGEKYLLGITMHNGSKMPALWKSR